MTTVAPPAASSAPGVTAGGARSGRRRMVPFALALLVALPWLVAGWAHLDADRSERGTRAAQAEASQARAARQRLLTQAEALEIVAVALTQETGDLEGAAAVARQAAADARAASSGTALAAWTTGARAADLTRCLEGLSRALNLNAVGDARAAFEVAAVQPTCQRAGQ